MHAHHLQFKLSMSPKGGQFWANAIYLNPWAGLTSFWLHLSHHSESFYIIFQKLEEDLRAREGDDTNRIHW